jgi:RsiW-degrading membrane proteinase PrsW (M82 family)
MTIRKSPHFSENASIVLNTSLIAGNATMLLKVHDTLAEIPAPPLSGRLALVFISILPPLIGLMCSFANLIRLELGVYRLSGGQENYFIVLGMCGISAPIVFWVIGILAGK